MDLRNILISLLALPLFLVTNVYSANVGLLITATGKYDQFVKPLIKSAEKHFCKNHNVTYYVYTDGKIPTGKNIVRIEQSKLGWPYDTMMRFEFYLKSKDLLAREDYLFACDSDMLFVNRVGDEILGDLVAIQHPGFVGKRGTYETNPESTAAVRKNEGKYYFCGGFYGGKREKLLRMFSTNVANIKNDLERGIIAVWHDESHWNRYCIDHPPTVILSPSYCYPESWSIPYKKRLLALDKNHKEVRK